MSTLSGFSRAIATDIIPGAAAGQHAVNGGIRAGDFLVSVTRLTDAATPVATDLTAEFSIPADTSDRVSNDTTDTTGDFLVITWVKAQ
ncbi:MAG: hypothetical protein AAF494_01745 [Pseudomonadota bacterium]